MNYPKLSSILTLAEFLGKVRGQGVTLQLLFWLNILVKIFLLVIAMRSF